MSIRFTAALQEDSSAVTSDSEAPPKNLADMEGEELTEGEKDILMVQQINVDKWNNIPICILKGTRAL
jgi:hypothetical protein